MNSRSEQKCSIEELKKLNQPREVTSPASTYPTEEQWTHLMRTLNAQYRLLERMHSAMETMTTQSEKLTKETVEICQRLEQVGKKKERRLSLPRIHFPQPRLAWLWAIPILVTLLVLWFAGAAIWNNLLRPILQLIQ